MTTQLDAAFPVHTRLTSTAPEGVIPQPRSAEVDLFAPATVPITRGVPGPSDPGGADPFRRGGRRPVGGLQGDAVRPRS